MTMLMREQFYGREEPRWSPAFREPVGPYYPGAPYGHYEDAPPYPLFLGTPYMSYNEPPYIPASPPRSIRATAVPSHPRPRDTKPTQPKKVEPEIELKIDLHSSRDEDKVRDTLRKLGGVKGVTIDRQMSKVTVTGKVDPQEVLKTAKKQKKKAEFFTGKIYSKAFIDFIQSKTGGEPEPEVKSSYHQRIASDFEADSHHHYHERETSSSFREYPASNSDRDIHDSYQERSRPASYSDLEPPSIGRDTYEPYQDSDRGSYYNEYTPTYGGTSNLPSYGAPSRSSYGYSEYDEREYRPQYEPHGSSYYDEYYEPSYAGRHEPHSYYDSESRSPYGHYSSSHYSSSYGEPESHPYRSYNQSQGYGDSGITNPNYMKRVIPEY